MPGDPNIYYAGAASGGVYKTTDGGVHWQPVFDDQPVQSIGSLAVATSDPNVVWAGTGEGKIRSHISVGQGIYRSTDAGKTWTLMGLEKTGRIPRIVIDPQDPTSCCACALGHAYGPQPERGVFRTTDGGKTWAKVLFVDENTGCSDIAMDPKNPRVLFAGMWQLEIHTWGRESGGPGSGLFMSRDGGATWKHLTGHGLPTRPVGKVAVAIAASNPNRVYALIETGDGVPWNGQPTDSGQVWRSDDGGENWRMVSHDHIAMGRAHYYSRMAVAPDNENEAYFLTASYCQVDRRRADAHGRAPRRGAGRRPPRHLDRPDERQPDDRRPRSGPCRSPSTAGGPGTASGCPTRRCTTSRSTTRSPTTSRQQAGRALVRGPSNSRIGAAVVRSIPRAMWHSVGGGESGWATPDPIDSNIVWSTASGSGMVGGIVIRYEENRRQFRNVEVWPDQSNGPAADVKYRFVWDAPFQISPHDHNTIYVGSQHVHQTTDGGQSWQIISPDLTLNDKSRQGSSGGLTPDNIGVEYAGVVYAIAESPQEGADLGGHQRRARADDARRREDVDERHEERPEPAAVGHGPQHRAVALRRGHRVPDGRLPPGEQPRSVRLQDDRLRQDVEGDYKRHSEEHAQLRALDPRGSGAARAAVSGHRERHLRVVRRRRELAAAAEQPAARAGVRHRCRSTSTTWSSRTYGRGFWILDDITPLQQLTDQVLAADVHLFPPRPAYRFRPITAPSTPYDDPTIGENPRIRRVDQLLPERPRLRRCDITILDQKGEVVRKLTGTELPRGSTASTGISATTPPKQIRLRTSPLYAPWLRVGPDGMADGARRGCAQHPGASGQLHREALDAGERADAAAYRAQGSELGRHRGGHRGADESSCELQKDLNSAADAVNQIEIVREPDRGPGQDYR